VDAALHPPRFELRDDYWSKLQPLIAMLVFPSAPAPASEPALLNARMNYEFRLSGLINGV
jgi:hypothetical protein